ncbi:MAG: DNA-binding protein [Clostridiales bacterium]|nr:DNA-binding protein [Clostridiales bacterium]
MNYITTKEASKKWGLSERRVQILCAQARIPGVTRLGWAWAIPIDAEKPVDGRYRKLTDINK